MAAWSGARDFEAASAWAWAAARAWSPALVPDHQRSGVDRQVRQPTAVLHVPDPDLTRPVGRDDPGIVVGEHGFQGEVSEPLEIALFVPVLVPEPDDAIATGGHQSPILGESDRERPAAVRPMFLILPPFSISQSLIVPSSLEEARTLESSRQLTSVMKLAWPRRSWNSAGLRLPDDQAVVAVAGREQDPVGAELRGRDPLGVLAHSKASEPSAVL